MALPLISEWIRVRIIDRIIPPGIPDLTYPWVFGTTPGIKDKNKLLVFSSAKEAQSSFDVSTQEYQLLNLIFSQDKVYPAPSKVFAWNITRSDYKLASLITGSVADNNALSWYADKYGDFGDRLHISLVNTTSNNSELSHTTVAKLNVGSGNSGLTFTQKTALYDVVRIKIVDPELPSQSLKVEVVNEDDVVPLDGRVGYRTLQGFYDYTIKITLATNSLEQVTTIADDIVQALTNPNNPAYNSLAASLVDCANAGDGTGVVSPFASTPIPVKVTIELTDDGANITTKAWQLAEYVNGDAELGPLVLVSNYNVSTGNGTVWEETGQLLMTEADPNPDGIADSDTGLLIGASDNAELAIEFTTSGSFKPASVYAKLRRVGNIADNKYVWFEIQTDATGLPSGTAVATTAKILASSISAVYGDFIEFKFPEHDTLASGTYHIVLKGDYTADGTNYIAVATDSVGSGGVSEIKDATWASDPTKNFAFRLFKEDSANPYLHIRRENTEQSPLELTRGLNAMEQYAEIHKMDVPYFMVCTSVDEVDGDRLELSNAMASREGIYITTNTEAEAANLSALSNTMDAMNSDRTVFAAHTNPIVERLDGAICGFFSAIASAMAAGALGISSRGMTLFWAQLNGVTPAKWSSTERALLFRNAPGQTAAITYQDDAGNKFVTGSWETAGGFADWRWQKDYIKLRLTLAYYKMQAEGPPTYDNPGIARIEAVTVGELNRLTSQGFIGAWDLGRSRGIYEAKFPRINQVSSDDFAKRIYRFSVKAQPGWAIEQLDATFEFSFFANVFAEEQG